MTTEQEQLDVIDAMYAAVFAGDVDRALTLCTPDAQWHGVTPAPVCGDHTMRSYLLEILPGAIASMPDYAVLAVERDTIDDLVISRLRTTEGSGVMVFRVVETKTPTCGSSTPRAATRAGTSEPTARSTPSRWTGLGRTRPVRR
jgi:ketosteroid isomerase-like protein